MRPRTHPLQLSLRRAAAWTAAGVALLVAPVAVAGAPAGAVATTPACQAVVGAVRQDLAVLAPASGTTISTADAEEIKAKATAIFSDAVEQHPDCENAIARLQAQLAASARQSAQIKGTPFWGPVGWAWNNVYYKVFSGNDIMMGMFGWALLLSPFILVYAVTSVLRGSSGSFRRPYVPPHLRTEQ